MKIDGIPDLEFGDDGFHLKSSFTPYESVEAIGFTATVTQQSINGIPSGKAYEATLRIQAEGHWTTIEPVKGAFGRLRKKGFNALQHANAALADITFTPRIERYEEQVRMRGFFSHRGYQFHESGYVFKDGRELLSILDPSCSTRLAPFKLLLSREVAREKKTFLDRLKSDKTIQQVEIDLETNRDCVIYMLSDLYRIRFRDAPPPQKRVNRKRLFYETVLRFGALVANADGRADPEELSQLKKYFELEKSGVRDAARIFNEQLHTKSTPRQLLDTFSSEFQDADELKESFLFGMLLVALADGNLHRTELELLLGAANVLGIDDASLARIFATAGVNLGSDGSQDRDQHEGAERQKRRTHDGADRRSRSARAEHLRVLGLDGEPSEEMLRQTYRMLVRRYHPDRLRGQGMPEAEIEKAGRILARINLAYDALYRRAR